MIRWLTVGFGGGQRPECGRLGQPDRVVEAQRNLLGVKGEWHPAYACSHRWLRSPVVGGAGRDECPPSLEHRGRTQLGPLDVLYRGVTSCGEVEGDRTPPSPAWRSLLNSWPEDVPFLDTRGRKKNDPSYLLSTQKPVTPWCDISKMLWRDHADV